MAERLLNIDILARAHRREADGHVPMVRRGNDHGVNALVREQFPEIVVKFRLQLLSLQHQFARVFAALTERVANRDGRGGIDVEKILQQAGPLSAHADVAELDFFARACCRRPARARE